MAANRNSIHSSTNKSNIFSQFQLTGFQSIQNSSLVSLNIDVAFERLQQLIQGHLISINLKNLKPEPLIEINYVKSRLTYFSIEQIDGANTGLPHNDSNFNITSSISTQNFSNGTKKANNPQQPVVKLTRIKTKKCKFDHNFKGLSKPLDFYLDTEHFMSVTEEATNIKLKSMAGLGGSSKNIETDSFDNMLNEALEENEVIVDKKAFAFLFTIELHSYLPVSRKTLSSTFRKKKRIFRGQCQIHENFIKSTQFSKKFILHEV
jgi:hypothetical protein